MLGAMTPRHGRRRTKQPVTVEAEPGSGRQYRANTLGQRETCTPQQPPANESGLGEGYRRRVCSRRAEQLDRIGNAAPDSAQLLCYGDVTESALLQRVPQLWRPTSSFGFADILPAAVHGKQFRCRALQFVVTHDKPLAATERSTSLVPPRMVNDGESSTARRNSRSNNDGVCAGGKLPTSSRSNNSRSALTTSCSNRVPISLMSAASAAGVPPASIALATANESPRSTPHWAASSPIRRLPAGLAARSDHSRMNSCTSRNVEIHRSGPLRSKANSLAFCAQPSPISPITISSDTSTPSRTTSAKWSVLPFR